MIQPAPAREMLAEMAIAKQDVAIASLVQNLIEPDWPTVTDIDEATQHRVENEIERVAESDEFIDRITAALLNGELIARWATERDALPIVAGAAAFADDPALFLPEMALRYWKEKIPLTDAQVELLRANLDALHKVSLAIAGEYSQTMMQSVAEVFARAIGEGMALSQFRQAFSEAIPGKSRALLETIFRTNMTKSYEQTRLDSIRELGIRVPFIQYLAITDDRVRATHGAMHRFVAASSDPIWNEWTPPNGYNCRCTLSPIPYTEAIRRGWAAYTPDRKGLVLMKGTRPEGDPPAYVYDEKKDALVRVKPDIGFGAGEKTSAVAA